MTIKKQTFEITVTFNDEGIYEGSALESTINHLLEEGVIEIEHEIKNEEILPDEDYIYDDLDD